MFRLGRAVVKVTAKDRDVLDICSDQPALWSMRVAMTGRFYKFGGWRVKLEVKLHPERGLGGSGDHHEARDWTMGLP